MHILCIYYVYILYYIIISFRGSSERDYLVATQARFGNSLFVRSGMAVLVINPYCYCVYKLNNNIHIDLSNW